MDLLAVKGGNLCGLTVSDGVPGNLEARLVIPPMKVAADQVNVIQDDEDGLGKDETSDVD